MGKIPSTPYKNSIFFFFFFVKKRFFENFISSPLGTHQKSIDWRPEVYNVHNRVGKVKSRNLKTTIRLSPTTKIPLFVKKRFFENFISRPSGAHQKLTDSRPEDIRRGGINPIGRNYLSHIYAPGYKAPIKVILDI